jgi:hypothetical protein
LLRRAVEKRAEFAEKYRSISLTDEDDDDADDRRRIDDGDVDGDEKVSDDAGAEDR